MKENKPLAKKLNIAAWITTVIVLALVGVMRIPTMKIDLGIDFTFLPPIHAALNTLTAIALIMAFYFVKQKNIAAHQKCNYWALGFSALFFVFYVLYHFTTSETLYCKQGTIRSIYFFMLISHIVLAGGVFPFVLFTFIRAYTGQIEKHRRMAKWVFPIWLYVAITGPIVYFMLQACY